MLGYDEGCEEGGGEGVFWEPGVSFWEVWVGDRMGWVVRWVGDLPPHALAYCRTPCLACSSGDFPGIGILAGFEGVR